MNQPLDGGPFSTRRRFLGRVVLSAGAVALASPLHTAAGDADAAHPFDLRPQPWQRRDEPILSARTTKEPWCKVVLYSPHVVFHGGRFHMWYLGTSTGTRTDDIAMGYAESQDGVNWKEYDSNPILTGMEIGWGDMVQTPFVLFDEDEAIFKMWFVSGKVTARDDQGRVTGFDQRLGYAVGADGIQWKVHPEPIYASGRSPSVIKEGPGRYRMWMNSVPDGAEPDALFANIFEFDSSDGIHWQRHAKPLIQPSGRLKSAVYTSVLKEGNTWYLWYIGHVDGGRTEIFCASSTDGESWQIDHERAAFPTRPGTTAFDSRYCSTPRVVGLADRYLLYYSARDWQMDYTDSQGRVRRDNSSPYSHIGVAVMPRPGDSPQRAGTC